MARDQQGDRFERIIGQRLAAGRNAGDANHPDAAIIGAYRERSLARDERARCERHFAQCARCSSALAALTRIDETVDRDDAIARGEGRGWRRLRGSLPLAAFGAAAAIVLIVVLKTITAQRAPFRGAHPSTLQSKSLAANSAPVAASPVPAAAKSAAEDLNNSLIAMNDAARAKPTSPLLEKSLASNAPLPVPAAGSMPRDEVRRASRDELARQKARKVEHLTELARASAKLESERAQAAPVPAPERASAAPAGVGSSMTGANAIVVEPPDHSAVWMVGEHGSISRYSKATGWVAQTGGAMADLTGGSAPSATICWIVGRAGTILRTVDGKHWTTIIAPVSDDLVGVIALGATDATISTASGRRFATSDGGANWRSLP